MKEKRTYTIDKLPADKTDWHKVAKISDKEIAAAARTDADAKLVSKKQLAKFKRVHSFSW